LKNKNLHIYSSAADKNEYDKLKGLVSGCQVNTLSQDIILDCVKERTLADLGTSSEVYVLHDGCDIRKPNSSALEHLGKVLSLQKQVVHGYKTLNSVAVNPQEQGVHLLDHQVYSNAMPNFVSQEALSKLTAQSAEIQQLVQDNKHINNVILFKEQATRCSEILKKDQPDRSICHIADREYDSEDIFSYLNDLKDHFVIRLKLSRASNEIKTVYTPSGKVSQKVAYHKLIDKKFAHHGTYLIDNLTIKGRKYTQVTCEVEWDTLKLGNLSYQVVRVTLKKDGKNIFDHPMLLITNRKITNSEEAKAVYCAYILRFKIEIVFRFLKQNLGWESIQVRDFNSIANLLALAFFLVGYFQEMETELKEHPAAQMLCKLALSKGKITLFFLLKGLEKLANYQEVSIWIEENNITQQEINELLQYLKTLKT
jgi:Transposase DDE domain